MVQQRLPIVNGDDGTWGDIINQFIAKEHYNTGVDNALNGGHETITIRPGTTAAGTAPLKFASGSLLTTPEAGAVEFATDKLYLTQTTSTTRKTIAMYDDTSGAVGDLHYRDSGGNFVRLGAGSANNVLGIAAGAPAWQTISNGMLPAMVAKTIKGNNTTGTTAASDLTVAQTQLLLADPSTFNMVTNGADPTGGSDATAAWNVCAAALNAAGKGIIYFPPGTYALNPALMTAITVSNVALVGADRGSSTIVPTTNLTNDVFTLPSGGAFWMIRDLGVSCTTARTAGAIINTNGCSDVTIDRFQTTNAFVGVNISGASARVTVSNGRMITTSGTPSIDIIINSTGSEAYIGPHITTMHTGGSRPIGINIIQATHFEINHCDINGCSTGLMVNPGAGQVVSAGSIVGTLFDACTLNGINLNAATATSTIKSIKFANSWASNTIVTSGSAGVISQGVAGGVIDAVSFDAMRCINNQTHGIQHGFGSNFRFLDCDLRGNSQSGLAAADGLNIAAGISNWSVLGGKSGGTDVLATGGNQRYGINVVAGASTQYLVTGTDLTGNNTAAISDNGTGQRNIMDNIGFIQTPPPVTAAQVIPITTVTRVGNPVTIPAATALVGTSVRITAYLTNSATASTSAITVKYGTLNTNADTTLATLTPTAGTAVADSAIITVDFIIRAVGASGSATVRAEVRHGLAATGFAGAATFATMVTAMPTISTTTANFLGLYIAETVASVVTVQSVDYELLKQ